MCQFYGFKLITNWLIFSVLGIFCISQADAGISKHYQLKISQSCTTDDAIAIIKAREVSHILGQQLNQISFFSFSESLSNLLESKQTEWQSIVVQIDKKDARGRFIMDVDNDAVLGADDEIVFRWEDAGKRLPRSSRILEKYQLIEVELKAAKHKFSKWLYINITPNKDNIDIGNIVNHRLEKPLISYLPGKDVIISRNYKSGFSDKIPFLIESFHWPSKSESGWSEDISDMMKIRHHGRFLGFPFQRSQDDYQSRLISVKQGPLRIIRRTENRIKVLWKIKTPVLYIDYIMMADGFVMDTMVDIPLNVSFFFSELETLTTMDWNPAKGLPELTIQANNLPEKLRVNGIEENQERNFNGIKSKQFSINSIKGGFDVKLDIPDNFPIKSQLYYTDDMAKLDPPENFPGQFGNVGFKTTGWENIDSELHHLKFTACIQNNH